MSSRSRSVQRRTAAGFQALCVALCVALAGTGCRRAAGDSEAAAARHYTVKGTVLAVDEKTGVVRLNTDAIPGYMMAMPMTYALSDANVATELHPGDRILAQLNVDGEAGPELDDVTVTAQANPNVLPPVQYHVPAVGEIVPNFALLDQSGRTVHLKQLRGKVVAMTFIYTRCPLANFCPLMSHNFAQMNAELAKAPKLFAATDLLSVSFDPAYDTPAVLRSYGGAYTGNYTRETFAHWQFAAPTLAELPKLERWFDLGVTPGSGNGQGGGTLSHSLSTLIVGRDGRVVAFNPTNDWTAAELTAKVRAAAGE